MYVHTGARRLLRKLHGYELEGVAKEAGGFIHLINSGAACLDANGEAKDAEWQRCYESNGGM